MSATWPKAQPAHLTPDEQHCLDLLGEAANLLRRIVGDGPNAAHDWAELAAHLHDLQGAVMAQAAARAYPTMLRPLGGAVDRIGPHL